MHATPARALFTGTEGEEQEPKTVVHVVQPKETVYSIARRYEVEVDDVRKWNDLETADIRIGQQIKINKTR
jgi:LysM repeat protein